jgi:hypothetical protein
MKKDGGTAFPESDEQSNGMTLRDYFAGQAMGYILDKSATVTDAAKLAYRYADAMIEERAQ